MPRLADGDLPALCHTHHLRRGETAVFSVTVRDHMMVAHSFRGEVFGPAQRLHGATFVVDATFRGADARRRRHRRRHRPGRPRRCAAVVGELTYRNLDDEPAFAGLNTTTEVLAQVVADRLAERIHAGALGAGGPRADRARVTLHESHVAWASYERDAVSVVHVVVPDGVDDPARPSGGNIYDRRVVRGPGARSAGRCASTRWPAPGRGRRRPARAALADALAARARRRAGAGRRARRLAATRGARAGGRPAAAGRAGAHAARRRRPGRWRR